jgi:hypothetical protein
LLDLNDQLFCRLEGETKFSTGTFLGLACFLHLVRVSATSSMLEIFEPASPVIIIL